MGPARERSHGDTYDGLVPANEQDQPEVHKKIWFLWLQGLDGSPAVVRQCRNSWLRMNPTWEFHLLSRDNLGDYTDIDVGALDHIGMSQVADLVRLDLLQKYGGVWADATCFCIRELDSWLPEYTQSGFFAFEKPGRDRAIASWFLASAPNNPLVRSLLSALSQYFGNTNLSNEGKGVRRAILQRSLSVNLWTTKLWFSSAIVNGMRVYPYYALHYMFAETIRTDSQSAAIWAATPRLSANIPHRLQDAGLFKPITPVIQREIDEQHAPLYKLTWKYDPGRAAAGCTLAYLLEM
jgi:hypothetical protein